MKPVKSKNTLKHKGKEQKLTIEEIAPQKSESKNKIVFAIIFILSFLLYGNTLNLDYALDDAIVITQNQFTKQGVDGIKDILTTDTFVGFFGKKKNLVAGGRYRPLSVITFAVEWEIFGENPAISHLVNVFLYILTGILLYLTLSKLLVRYETKHWYFSLPFLSTILFIAHPLHTEVIANIKGRDEIMTFLGAIASLLFTLKYLESDNKKYLIYSSLSMFLALMSKENAITFLAVIPLSVYFFTNHSNKKNLTSLLPLIAAAFLFVVIRQKVLGSLTAPVAKELMNNPFLDMTSGQQYATIMFTLGIYIKLLVFPHPLTFDYYPYHIEAMNWSDVSVIIALVLYGALAVYAIKGIKSKSIISFCIIYYLATISIVSNILFAVGTFMNERFVYVSSLGFCIIMAYLIVSKIPMFVKSAKQSQLAIISLLGVILILYSGKTISRNFDWKNDFTLFTHDVNISENSAKSTCSAGGKLIEEAIKPGNEAKRQEYLTKSLLYLKRSVKIHPSYTDAWLLLGNCYFELNKNYDSTIAAYKQILYQNPEYDRVYSNVEIIFAKYDNVDNKIRIWEDLHKINSRRFETNYALGQLYGRYKNNLQKSIEFLEKAVQAKPSSVAANKDLGVAFGMAGNFVKSAEQLEKAVKLDPNDDQILYNLGVTYFQLNQKEKAQEFIKRSEQVKASKIKK